MSWEELCEKAKKLGYQYNKDYNYLYHNDYHVTFYSNGEMFVGCTLVVDDRTPDQIYQIMEAFK